MKPLLLLALATALLACGDDSGEGAGGSGANGGAGGSGGSGAAPLAPEDFIDPKSYDCNAGDVSPPERPYRFGCLHDSACTSRFVVAHRMGGRFAPENSLSALRGSIAMGVDVAETDVRSTADGEVVLVHDVDIDRTVDGTGLVSELTLAELTALPLLPGASPPGGDFSCDRVPTIQQALAVARGKIVIEFETKETPAAITTAQYLSDQGLYQSAYIQCTPDECDAIRAVVPDVPIMVRVKEMSELALAAAYDPPPIMVELSPESEFLEEAVLDGIHAYGAKTFTDVFTSADAAWLLGQDASLFDYFFDQQLDALQTEFPHIALWGIGRATPL